MINAHVLIIGAGNMGKSIIQECEYSKLIAKVSVCDQHDETLYALAKNKELTKIKQTTSNLKDVDFTDIQLVFLAIKPQQFEEVAADLKPHLNNEVIIVSIMAGVPLAKIETALGTKKVVRTMPNLGIKVGESMTAFFPSPELDEKQREFAEDVLSGMGSLLTLEDEKHFDAFTAIAGSGPAYFYWLADRMSSWITEQGFATEIAELLVKQTFYGTARIAVTDSSSLTELKQAICSKGGTTEAALKNLKDNEVNKIFDEAFDAAKKRSEELGS